MEIKKFKFLKKNHSEDRQPLIQSKILPYINNKKIEFIVYPDQSMKFNTVTLPVIADVLHLSPTNNIENFLRQCVENNQLYTLHKVIELS